MAAKKKTKKKAAAKTKKTAAKKAPATKKKVAAKKAAPKKKVAAKKAAPKKKVAAKKAAPKKKVAAKKAAPKKAVAAKAAPAPKAKAKKAAPKASVGGDARRDATGHLRPQYAKELLEKSREFGDDDGNDTKAFFKKSRAHDDLAEELGEEAVQSMTSGEDASDRLEARTAEEDGGPFVTTDGTQEYARGTDKSNPSDATREPFPKV